MSSSREPRWRRLLRKVAPFLFKECPGGNFHWRLDRLCHCQVNEHHAGWNGGVYDFRDNRESPYHG